MSIESEAIASIRAQIALTDGLPSEVARKVLSTTHPEMVDQLMKPGADVLADLTPESSALVHMALGVMGEAGELADAIKKHAFYRRELDLVNVIEELGDIEFYLQGIRRLLGIDRETTLTANKVKLLGKRYASGVYSNAAAIARADKAGEE